jgi:hypothetical protein
VAIYNTGLLVQENKDLCLFMADNMAKKSCSRHLMTPTDGLSFKEARDLISSRNNELQAGGGGSSSSTLPTSERLRHAPPRCTNCGVQGHKRTSCQVPNHP